MRRSALPVIPDYEVEKIVGRGGIIAYGDPGFAGLEDL